MLNTETPMKGHSALRALLSGAALVIVLAGMKLASDFLVPVFLAFFVAILSMPMVTFLRARRFPGWLAVLLTLLLNFSVLIGVGFLLSALAQDFQLRWTDYYEFRLRELFEGVVAWVQMKLEGVGVKDTEEKIGEIFNIDAVIGLVKISGGAIAAKLAEFLKVTFIVLMLMVFMLTEGKAFVQKIPRLKGLNGPDLSKLNRAASDIQKYLAIKTGVSSATGVLAFLLCYFLDLDFPLLWGIVAFCLNYIPAIGSIFAAIPPFLLALIQHGFGEAFIVLAGYGLINMIWGNLIEPTLMGQRFGISTMVVLLSVMFWGYIFGPVGMFLAVPLTMVVKVMLDNSSDLRWVSFLLEKNNPTPKLAQVLTPTKDDDFIADGKSEASTVAGKSTSEAASH